jgi:uncharacterized protein YkwD
MQKFKGALTLAIPALVISIAGPVAAADAGLVAPRSKCSGQANHKAPEPVQEDAMRCLINYARDHSGGGNLNAHRALERASGRKVGDVVNCGFSHTACGNPADLYARRFGYASGNFQWGENLAWGRGKRGSARNIIQAWLSSPPHRSTMLRGSFDDFGIGLKHHGKSAVWVLQVGCHGCN